MCQVSNCPEMAAQVLYDMTRPDASGKAQISWADPVRPAMTPARCSVAGETKPETNGLGYLSESAPRHLILLCPGGRVGSVDRYPWFRQARLSRLFTPPENRSVGVPIYKSPGLGECLTPDRRGQKCPPSCRWLSGYLRDPDTVRGHEVGTDLAQRSPPLSRGLSSPPFGGLPSQGDYTRACSAIRDR